MWIDSNKRTVEYSNYGIYNLIYLTIDIRESQISISISSRRIVLFIQLPWVRGNVKSISNVSFDFDRSICNVTLEKYFL